MAICIMDDEHQEDGAEAELSSEEEICEQSPYLSIIEHQLKVK